MRIKIEAVETKFAELQPGDLYTTLPPGHWTSIPDHRFAENVWLCVGEADEHADSRRGGKKLYKLIVTVSPDPAGHARNDGTDNLSQGLPD